MELIVKNLKSHPCCPHGPALMFERYSSDNCNNGRRFYACSACRNRNSCSFFHWVDDTFSAERVKYWKQKNSKVQPPFSHDEYMRRLESFNMLPSEDKRFCKTCSLLVLPSETGMHINHEILCNIHLDTHMPSHLLKPLENNKSEAQYYFSGRTIDLLMPLFQDLGFVRVISIGTPTIHEYIISKMPHLSSLLLDIDHRYMQFYSDQQFCHYNLFNNCFFGGVPAKEKFKKFLCKDDGTGIVLILDPPFGGLVDAITYTLQKICHWWRKGSRKDIDEEIPIIWFFPYFNENRIIESMPSLKMMDYKVDYINKRFKQRKQGSLARIFTNIKPSLFILPQDEGYKFCSICERYVCEENQHCPFCKACTTKSGKTYKHCSRCQKCVKSSYEHCESCRKCVYPEHKCEEVADPSICYVCKGIGHKKSQCPLKSGNCPKKRRKV